VFLPSNQHPTAHRMYKKEICTFKTTPIKCCKIKISYLHQLINKLSNLPFCCYFPPLPLDVTNLKKLPERKDSVLYLVQTDTKQQCTVHFPHVCTQNSSALYIFHMFIHKTPVHCTFSTRLYTKQQCTLHFPHVYTQNTSALYIFHTFIHKTTTQC